MTRKRTFVEIRRIAPLAAALSTALAAGVAFGRGEGWLAKPFAPSPVATLTNEEQDEYILRAERIMG